ncbi:MAG: BMP family ABC transporter substrate-binding protein [Nitrospinota bacterium]|nr:BMP family ABC transporter substrate-binding protein [Nitrospinota bacterium]
MTLGKRVNIQVGLMLITALAIFLPWTGGAWAKDIRAGFIYVSPSQDAGWSHSHDLGRQVVEKMPGVTTDYVDSISEYAYAESVITHMAISGHDIIFATSFGYMESIQKVAPRFPDTIFMHCAGNKRAKNIGVYFGRMYQARYLTGLVAGATSRTGVVGYVAAYPIVEVVRGINAFTLGVLEMNPKAKVHVRWVRSWHNPEKEAYYANELVNMKADVLTQHQDSPAIQIVAQKRGVYSIGYNQDMSAFAPKAHLTAAIWRWEVIYEPTLKQAMAGTWKSEDIWWGLDTGVVDLAAFGPMVGKKIRDKVALRKQQIINGHHTVFSGPVVDQEGAERIAEGLKATDKELLGMNWFVKGVVGSANPE